MRPIPPLCFLTWFALAAPAAAQSPDPPAAAAAQSPEPAAAPAAAAPAPAVVELLRLSGTYADLAEQPLDVASLLAADGGQVKPFYELVDELERLASSEDSAVALLDLSAPVHFTLPHLAELRRCVQKLRQAGKKCYAYLEDASRSQYLVASQCDEVLLADLGSIDFGSLSMSTVFLRDAMDLLGVQADVVRCGDFKGATEPFTRSTMSPHLRQHYVEMLSSMNDALVDQVAKGRGMQAARVRELQGQRLFTAKEALLAGLVDRLVPREGAKRALQIRLAQQIEVKDVLGQRRKRDGFNFMALMQNLLKPKDEVEVEEPKTIAVLHLSGTILDGTTAMPGSIVSGPAVASIRQLVDNENISGVVIRINSPGGSATASEAIMRALERLAQTKPVVFSMGDTAASGGYYITCIGRPILAETGTITGSIGVFGMKLNLGPLMRRIGIHQELVALDEESGLDAFDRGLSERDRDTLQRHVDELYDRFLGYVAKSRGLPLTDVEAIAGGRVWSGRQAVENKLVDRIGGLQDAIAMVAAEAVLQPDKCEVVHLPRPRSFMDNIAAQLVEMRVLASKLAGGLPGALLQRAGGLRGAAAVLFDAVAAGRPPRIWALPALDFVLR